MPLLIPLDEPADVIVPAATEVGVGARMSSSTAVVPGTVKGTGAREVGGVDGLTAGDVRRGMLASSALVEVAYAGSETSDFLVGGVAGVLAICLFQCARLYLFCECDHMTHQLVIFRKLQILNRQENVYQL